MILGFRGAAEAFPRQEQRGITAWMSDLWVLAAGGSDAEQDRELSQCHKGYSSHGSQAVSPGADRRTPPPPLRFVLQRKGSADFIVELQRSNSSSSLKRRGRKQSLQCAKGLQFRSGLPEQLRKEQISAGYMANQVYY